MWIDRLIWYINAQRRAHGLDFKFFRRKGFKIPDEVRLNGATVPIHCPPEHGCRIDFIGIFLSDCYHLETVKRLDNRIRTVIDVGANCGWFAIAARNHFPQASIHAYEPSATIQQVLQYNTRDLGIVVHEAAIGAQWGTAAIVSDGESNQARTIDGGDIQLVPFSAVVEGLNSCVDLVKLDCEGAEWDLFQDPQPWSAVRWLTMEYHLRAKAGATHRHAARTVAELGFDVIKQQPSGDFGLLFAKRSGR